MDPLVERKIEHTSEGLNHDCFNWLERVAINNEDNGCLGKPLRNGGVRCLKSALL